MEGNLLPILFNMPMRRLFGLFIIPFYLLMVFAFYLSYSNYSKTIPFSYYDEFWWVNDSYLAELYFNSDFGNNIWKSEDAIHQPISV